MIWSIKHKAHIDTIWRTPSENSTRLNKLRLDKNERIEPFTAGFWREFAGEIGQEMVQAYPEVWPLYEQLARHHGLTPEHFLLTAGSDAAIRHCYDAFVSPGDQVYFPHPTFAMVGVYAELYGAEARKVTYDCHLSLDVSYLVDALDEKSSLVILANPNSPTGTHISNARVAEILDKAALLRIPVLIDEAYHGFCPQTAIELIQEYPNLIVARTFSKVAGMAGLRIGYVVGQPELVQLLAKFRPMYEVNSVGILCAGKILDHWHIAEEYARKTIEGRNRFVAFLDDLGFPAINTQTNFVHVDFGALKEPVLDALAREGILVRGVLNLPGYENFTRFSVGPWEEMLPVVATVKRMSLRNL